MSSSCNLTYFGSLTLLHLQGSDRAPAPNRGVEQYERGRPRRHPRAASEAYERREILHNNTTLATPEMQEVLPPFEPRQHEPACICDKAKRARRGCRNG